jgi:hypothetical protein
MDTPATDPLLHRLQQQQWPELALDHPAPAVGQLWRASWSADTRPFACTVAVVVDVAPGARLVEVVPTTDDEIGDDGAVKVTTTNGMSISAWTGMRQQIYKFTLEHRLDDITADSVSKLFSVMNGTIPGDWTPILDVLDDRTVERADLADRLAALADADWVPLVSAGRTVGDLATDAGVDNATIAATLDITPGDARRLRQGGRPPTADEIRILTGVLGSEPASTAAFDPDLVADLDEPEFRPQLMRRASTRFGDDEAAARVELAGELMATSFRHREPGGPNWKQVIRDALVED